MTIPRKAQKTQATIAGPVSHPSPPLCERQGCHSCMSALPGVRPAEDVPAIPACTWDHQQPMCRVSGLTQGLCLQHLGTGKGTGTSSLWQPRPARVLLLTATGLIFTVCKSQVSRDVKVETSFTWKLLCSSSRGWCKYCIISTVLD